MTYPGNTALAADVQKRLQDTFAQTLELVAAGKRQEAMLGCDFILQMDPLFAPARDLAEDLRSGGSGAAPANDAWGAALTDEPLPDYGVADRFIEAPADEGSVDFALPPLDGDEGFVEPGLAMATDPESELRALAAARRWQEFFELASAETDLVASRPDLRQMVAEAQAAAEAAPYVNRFLDAAREAAKAGNTAEVERLLAKARSLDATHPAIDEILASQARYVAPPSEPSYELDGADLPALSFADLEAPAPEPSFGGFSLTPPSGGVETSFGDLDGDSGFGSPGMGGGGGFSLGATAAPPLGNLDLGTPDLGFGEGLPVLEAMPAHTGSESDQRIADLLQEGRTAFTSGDYQAAIDAWSRIFLVDIDHPEAARLIEGARKAKAEVERRAEESYHEALDAIEAGDLAKAKTALAAVLQIQPNNVAARDYLQQIEAGRKPEPPPRSRDTAGSGVSLARLEASDSADAMLKEEIMVPPEPGEARSRKREAAAPIMAARKGKPLRTFLTVGGLVLVVAGAAGWFLLTQRERFFPNSDPKPAPAAAPAAQTVDVLERARKLRDEGKTASAIALLKRIPPSSPQYRAAQPLLAELEGATVKPAAGAPVDADAQRREQLVAKAREAFAQRELLRTRELLVLAAAVAPLEGADKAMQAEVDAGLAPIEQELKLFADGEYEMALPKLWKLHEANRNDKDIRRLLVDSYYNVAVLDLQRGDAGRAAQSLQEALTVDPGDETMKRLYRLAQTYSQRSPDLLYRTYVKYLAKR